MHPEWQRYWLRIGLGALAVFGVGMGIVTGVRRSAIRVKTLTESNDPIGIPLAFLPFRVDGAELGTLKQLELERSAPDDVTAIKLTVRAADSAAARRLDGCLLTVPDEDFIPGHTEFRCVHSADSATGHLKVFGQIVIEPEGKVFTFLVPADRAHEWRRHRMGARTADKVVRIKADSHGAVIDVEAGGGRKRFHLQADSSGANITVHKDSGPAAR